jgi:hypothetical protein
MIGKCSKDSEKQQNASKKIQHFALIISLIVTFNPKNGSHFLNYGFTLPMSSFLF